MLFRSYTTEGPESLVPSTDARDFKEVGTDEPITVTNRIPVDLHYDAVVLHYQRHRPGHGNEFQIVPNGKCAQGVGSFEHNLVPGGSPYKYGFATVQFFPLPDLEDAQLTAPDEAVPKRLQRLLNGPGGDKTKGEELMVHRPRPSFREPQNS